MLVFSESLSCTTSVGMEFLVALESLSCFKDDDSFITVNLDNGCAANVERNDICNRALHHYSRHLNYTQPITLLLFCVVLVPSNICLYGIPSLHNHSILQL